MEVGVRTQGFVAMPHRPFLHFSDLRTSQLKSLLVHLIALSVLYWGIAYRTSLYRIDSGSSSSVPQSKLMSEERQDISAAVSSASRAPLPETLCLLCLLNDCSVLHWSNPARFSGVRCLPTPKARASGIAFFFSRPPPICQVS